MLADGRLGVLDFGAVDRLPNGLPPFIGKLLRIIHTDGDIREAEDELREQGFVRPGIDVDLDALYAFLAPLAEPSRLDTFKFSREWLRSEAARVTDPRSSSLGRRLNLPPSYVLIHRVSTEGIGVLCQLGSEGPFRAELIRWMPGYATDGTAPGQPGPDGTGPDSTGPDSTSPDSTSPDSTGPDGTSPDGTGLNGTGLDGTSPDGTGPDGAGLNGTGLNGTRLDGTTFDPGPEDRDARPGDLAPR
jgi:hypothetical protein